MPYVHPRVGAELVYARTAVMPYGKYRKSLTCIAHERLRVLVIYEALH